MEIIFLNQAEVQRLLVTEELLSGLEHGFKALSAGEVIAPNRNEVVVPDAGSLLGMPAWSPDQNISVKLVSVFHGNAKLGLPGHQALICLFDYKTGTPLAVMDGEYITAMRTAAAAAISTRLLARHDSQILSIIGAGTQGHSHLKIISKVRDFSEIRVTSLYLKDAQQLAESHPKARLCETYEEAVHGADVICLCTNSSTPVIQFDWLSPGSHLTSVGWRPPGGELPREAARRGKLFVETRRAFEPPPAGSAELAGLDPTMGTELGEVLLGKYPGRQTESEITVYKSMGHAMEDLVAANLVYQQASQQGTGVTIKL